MKLYTIEQVRKAIDLGRDYYDGFVRTEKDIIDELTPIELPSDEEMHRILSYAWFQKDTDKRIFINGAKWMREQILNQNK